MRGGEVVRRAADPAARSAFSAGEPGVQVGHVGVGAARRHERQREGRAREGCMAKQALGSSASPDHVADARHEPGEPADRLGAIGVGLDEGDQRLADVALPALVEVHLVRVERQVARALQGGAVGLERQRADRRPSRPPAACSRSAIQSAPHPAAELRIVRGVAPVARERADAVERAVGLRRNRRARQRPEQGRVPPGRVPGTLVLDALQREGRGVRHGAEDLRHERRALARRRAPGRPPRDPGAAARSEQSAQFHHSRLSTCSTCWTRPTGAAGRVDAADRQQPVGLRADRAASGAAAPPRT